MDQQPTTPQANPAPAPGHQEKNIGMAILAYIIFFIPLLTDAKNDTFVKFHVKQGIVVFGMALIVWVIRMLMPWYLLWHLYWLFNLLSIVVLVFAVIGIINAANSKKEPLPLVGSIANILKF